MEEIQKTSDENYSLLLNSSNADPIRDLLKQVWRQHNAIVQELKAELYTANKKASKQTTCHQCQELKSELLSKNLSFQAKLDEKEKIINYLEAKMHLSSREKVEEPQLCRKDILASKVTANALTLVPETQDSNCPLKPPDIVVENHFTPSTVDGTAQLNAYVPETQDRDEIVQNIEETAIALQKPHPKRKQKEVNDIYVTVYSPCKEDKILQAIAAQAFKSPPKKKCIRSTKTYEKDVAPTSVDHTLPSSSIVKLEPLTTSTESPSLLFASNFIAPEKTKDNGEIVASSNSCEFLSSVKNHLNWSGEVKKSPSKAKEDISFSPAKRKSRKLNLKQTKLDGRKQLKLDDIFKNDSETSTDANISESEMLIGKMGETSEDDVDSDATFFEEPKAANYVANRNFSNGEVSVKYQEVVRKKEDRKKLDGHNCHGCEMYYKDLNLSENELKQRMKYCSRHRSKHPVEKSPEHFWEVGIPDTQECIERGYMNKTQKIKLKPRQRKNV